MTQPEYDESWLVAGCRNQDRKAQRALYERFRVPLYRMCLRYAADAQEAEDFLHDGILKVLQDIDQFRGTGALGGWVRRVVLNVVLQKLRKRPRLLGEEHLPAGEELPDVDIGEEMTSLSGRQIFNFVRELPQGYRTVFSLYYLENLTHKEIAVQLGITEGASKSQLSKAKRRLRSAILQQFPHLQSLRK
ncbi:RNA polymerase sigma factor [Lewinella sp. W8]|uniref:RNA polymerase sigma factor n=1 Tax=Lewinella sp. W8 TaxID=2528208 RepID=UPI00106864E6|nr:sigma-70 family RNA polymerase sigma factor [Lewinella sp. W8]MTB52287.1 sigma-70 family RNA polymerase sigma factor [Lewinella sp. W8]